MIDQGRQILVFEHHRAGDAAECLAKDVGQGCGQNRIYAVGRKRFVELDLLGRHPERSGNRIPHERITFFPDEIF